MTRLRSAYDRGHSLTLSDYVDAPYLAASLLKLFLRSLPTPIFPPVLHPILRGFPVSTSPANGVEYIGLRLLPSLTPQNFILLQYLVNVLHLISQSAQINFMTTKNLAICLAPCLLGDDDHGDLKAELELCGLASVLLTVLIDQYIVFALARR